MNMIILFAVACFLFGNFSFSQTLVLKYTSSIDYNPAAYQYGQAVYLGPSFVGLKMISFESSYPEPVNNKSRFVALDLKGNTKWMWNAFSYGVTDFYVEPSPSGSFWIKGYDSSRDPDGILMIYDKKRRTWSESSIGQGDPVNFLARGTPNITSGLCTVTKNESGVLTFYVYKY
jgi:hypothetical protein